MPSTTMVSSLTLSTLRDRVEERLGDSTNTRYATATIDAAIRAALQEYSYWRPCEDVATLLMTACETELGSDFAGCVRVVHVIYPYNAATPEYPPELPKWQIFKDAGVFRLWLDVSSVSGTEYVRVFFHKAHTLKDLDSATVSTFPPSVDWLLELGAAGHAMYARAIQVSETADVRIEVTPNLLVAASRLLREFRFQIRALSA